MKTVMNVSRCYSSYRASIKKKIPSRGNGEFSLSFFTYDTVTVSCSKNMHNKLRLIMYYVNAVVFY